MFAVRHKDSKGSPYKEAHEFQNKTQPIPKNILEAANQAANSMIPAN